MNNKKMLDQVILSYFDYENNKITLEKHLENIKRVAVISMLNNVNEEQNQ